MRTAHWDIFISYATEDKISVADPLAKALSEAGVSVWYDQFQLRLGDRLMRSVSEGLSRSRFGVVVLSPAFFNKHWPLLELDALAQREEGGHKVILPVWHDVSVVEVRLQSLLLADRIAARWSDGVAPLVKSITGVLNSKEGVDGAGDNTAIGAVLRLRERTQFLWQEIKNHLNEDVEFSAPIRGDTLKSIEADLTALRDLTGLDYEVSFRNVDMRLREDILDVTIRRTPPTFWRIVVKGLSFERHDLAEPDAV